MKLSFTGRYRWLLVLSLALTGCGGLPGGTPVAATTGLHVWLDQPPDGATLPVAMFTLRAHARDAGGSGVETITFLVSSGGPPVTIGSVTTDAALPLVTAAFDWNPSAPGEYAIQAQAFNRLGYVFSVPARVCVGLVRAPGGGCAMPGPTAAGRKLQGLVQSDLNADGNAADPGEGPLVGVLVTLSGCDSQTVHTNPASSDPAQPEGAFAFGVAALSGCSIRASLAGWRFESFEGSTAYPITWPADENPHVILMAPAGGGTATPTSMATAKTSGPTATVTPNTQKPPSGTPTKAAFASATPTKPTLPSDSPTKTALPSDTPTQTASPNATPSDTPQPTNTKPPTATATPAPSDTPKPTDTKPPADTAPPAMDKISAAPNPTFYGNSCSKDQSQFTVGATVTDPSGVASVTLFYRYGIGGSTGPWQSVAMSSAGGDQYTATVHNDATAVFKLLGGADGYVEYYLQAKDTLGNSGQSPSPVITIKYCVG